MPEIAVAIGAGDTMYEDNDAHYLSVGLSALHNIEAAIPGPPPRILDLACGWGRVTRLLRARYPAARITVCDTDAAGMAFTAQLVEGRTLPASEDLAALRLPESYDLIWVGSLFTHISEQQARGLLRALAAGLSARGTLVASSHGPTIAAGLREWGYGLRPRHAADVLDGYAATGFGHTGYEGGADYGISLSDRAWWAANLPAFGLDLASYAAQAWDGHQDVVVARRSDTPAIPAPGGADPATRAERARVAAYDPSQRSFDADVYLAGNPDVAAAVEGGQVKSAWEHFWRFGRAEGRAGSLPRSVPNAVNAEWYLARNPDVRAAIESGALASAEEHYRLYGRAEGRMPAEGVVPELTEAERAARVGDFWSAQPGAEAGWYWMAHPMVRERVNRLASGDPAVDCYGRLALLLQERGVPLPIPRAVSLGCGFGALERSLAQAGIVAEIDAYDIAPGAIEEARRLAAEAGLPGLRYHVLDLESATFPANEVDVVFAHSSVHHVERLEELFATVTGMLKPGGLFHLNEFVGPTRFQWTDTQLAEVNRFLDSLPGRLRRLPNGSPRPRQERPSVAAMIAADPSESVRSSDIIPLLGQCFDIVELRQTGGALLHLGLAEIAQNFDTERPEDRAILDAFFTAEDEAMRAGRVGTDFAIITAAKRG